MNRPDLRLKCVAVRSPRGAKTTEIDWGDGHKGVYPHELLRGYCPCAGCQGHSGTIAFIPPSDIQTDLEDIEAVGNYALRLQWFDGHGSGLYSYKYLRDLCQCDECRPGAAKDDRGILRVPDASEPPDPSDLRERSVTEGPAEKPSPARTRGADERRRLLARAAIVGAGTLASRLLGLARDVVWAAVFSREETDAFFVAFTIPNALRQLLGEGAMSSAVVPILTTTLENDGEDAAKLFFARARGASLVALSIVTVLGMIFARPITDLFAAGYHDRPAEFERTVLMTRVLFPYIFFMGTAALGAAALNAKRAFGVAAFAPGLLNVAFLVAAFALPPVLIANGIDRAQALTIGALVGGVLQVVAQWPALRRIGFFQRPIVDFSDPKVREIGRRIAPMAFGIGVYYVDLTLSRRFLSELGPGAQSYFTWAMRLCDFPQGIFVMALSTAALPSLSALAARGERSELAETFAHGLKLALFVALPASAMLSLLAHPIVVALFQRGQFGAIASTETAAALVWQGGAVWTVAVVRQTVPVFYALGDSKTPVWISAIDLVAFIVLALVLRGPLGHVGISIAVAGSSFVQMALLLIVLRRRLPELAAVRIWASVARSTLSSLVGAFLGFAAATMVARVSGPGAIGRTLPAIAAVGTFGVAFLLASHASGSGELAELVRAVKARLGRKRATATPA